MFDANVRGFTGAAIGMAESFWGLWWMFRAIAGSLLRQ